MAVSPLHLTVNRNFYGDFERNCVIAPWQHDHCI